MGNYLRIKKGNFLAVCEKHSKMIEIEATSLETAKKNAYDYFNNRYNTKNSDVLVIQVPDCISVIKYYK